MQRGKVLIQFIHCLSLKEEGSQGRNSGSAATWRQELKPLKEYRLLTFSLWLAQTASYTTHNHMPRADTVLLRAGPAHINY